MKLSIASWGLLDHLHRASEAAQRALEFLERANTLSVLQEPSQEDLGC